MALNNSKTKSEPLESSLITACAIGDIKTVVNILEDGGDINYQDTDGTTPLHVACFYGHEEIVNYLLYKGASLTSTKTGQTPLHLATVRNKTKIVHILLQHVDCNDKDDIDFINIKTSDGLTALHFAAVNDNLEIVNTLLMYGAIYNIQDATGLTPKDFTKNVKIEKIFRLIEELFKDVQNGHFGVINKLKYMKVDRFSVLINARNNEGKTIIMMALDKNHNFVEELEDLIPGLDIDQFQYLKKVSYQILMSMIELEIGARSVDYRYYKTQSYSGCVVEYLKKVYKLVNQYKSWLPGKINNSEIGDIVKLLRCLRYDPSYVTQDKADSFVTKFQRVKDYKAQIDLNGLLETINTFVGKFYKFTKTKIRELHFINLIHACLNDDSLGAENLLTRIRNETPSLAVHHNQDINKLAVFVGLYNYEPIPVIALTYFDGFTPLHFAALNGHLEVIKTLLRHGAEYNSKNDVGETPKSISENRTVIDFLTLVNNIFVGVKKGDINVLNKLAALKKDDFLAVTRARNLQGNSLMHVAEIKKHNEIASGMKTLM